MVERDDPAAGRRGVPQSTQVPALLPGGLDQIERWFPGYARRFDAVAFMRAHPSTLAAPSVLLRSILVNLRGRQPDRRDAVLTSAPVAERAVAGVPGT